MSISDNLMFDGKVALVTGGNSGIGRETAISFAQKGANVVIAARRESESLETLEQIHAAGGKAEFVKTDVSDESQVEAMVAQTIKAFGRLDFAFNNAAITGEAIPLDEYRRKMWDQVISINLTGVRLCMQNEIKYMKANGGGSIVNTTSIAGHKGSPNLPAYSVSKWGVIGMTKAAARGYGQYGIRVNAVSPGHTETPMLGLPDDDDDERLNALIEQYPLGRIGQSDDIAKAVIWLCSDSASFITGVALPVEGGIIA
jgi:NAD(P)-dependent dehydrogenase (short-subunit alcohol dehydrogenase family)